MSRPNPSIAYVVNQGKAKEGEDRNPTGARSAQYGRTRKGGGFDIVIYDQLAVSGRITCTVPKEKDKPAGE